MKKVCLLSGMMAVFATLNVNADVTYPGGLKEKHIQRIEDVQREKIKRQRQLARPSIYTMVDALIKEENAIWDYDENGQWIEKTPARVVVDWPAVFRILDSMRGVIDVNEYATYDNQYPLLWIAVQQGNFLAAKTLLEKYKANPNFGLCTGEHAKDEECNMDDSLLVLARKKGDVAMGALLTQHGAHPIEHIVAEKVWTNPSNRE
jgi:hypothetical protein